MAWVSKMWNYARARDAVRGFAQTPPGSDPIHITELLVFAAEDGDRAHVAFMKQVIDGFEWDPIAAKTLARSDDYLPEMELAGACIALLGGDAKAKRYLAELAIVFRSARRPSRKAVGILAHAVMTGEWRGTSEWHRYPVNSDELHEGVIESRLEDALEIVHSPHSSMFGVAIFLLFPLALCGEGKGTPEKMLKAFRTALGPRPSRRGELLYRRATALPLRPDVLERHVPVGIVAIDLGEKLDIYHDGFSWNEGKWQFDPDGEHARAILELGDEQWRDVRDNVSAETWKSIESKRETAEHILAIDPRLVKITDDARERAAARFEISLEVVPFFET